MAERRGLMDRRLRQLGLVAHRGYPRAFPENTLPGYRQSVLHGATLVETDVQCTRDGVPVLYHDDDTRRLSGVAGSITGRSWSELQGKPLLEAPEKVTRRAAARHSM